MVIVSPAPRMAPVVVLGVKVVVQVERALISVGDGTLVTAVGVVAAVAAYVELVAAAVSALVARVSVPVVVTVGFVTPATATETDASVGIEQVPPLSARVITFVRVADVYAAVAEQLLTSPPLTVTAGVLEAIAKPVTLP